MIHGGFRFNLGLPRLTYFVCRLVQLDAAIQMELWQEAYKAVEDIHGLMSLSKKVGCLSLSL